MRLFLLIGLLAVSAGCSTLQSKVAVSDRSASRKLASAGPLHCALTAEQAFNVKAANTSAFVNSALVVDATDSDESCINSLLFNDTDGNAISASLCVVPKDSLTRATIQKDLKANIKPDSSFPQDSAETLKTIDLTGAGYNSFTLKNDNGFNYQFRLFCAGN